MAHAGAPTATAGLPGPRPAQYPPQENERVEEKTALASWWRNFKRSDKKPREQQAQHGIFGVPLQDSIRYANVAISLLNDEGQSYIYGYVPIVVAKCGVYLKEKATDVEGIFRLAGSEKRIKELKMAFDSPDRYGKGLDWTGYTVHDAANILRRYFNQLPEPIIPLDFYERFRQPLRDHQAQAVGSIDAQSPSIGDFDPDAVIRQYQVLITELPPLNRQLLLYILDLLAVFASKSDLNKMTTPNLAAIFQPGILSHPQHDMAPGEYRLSQDVLIFLIVNQDSFLIGMQGTEADPDTVREVQSGAPSPSKSPATPTSPNRSRTAVGRTSSNASAGAESVRKWGNLRRNVSVSSKQSRQSEALPASVATPTLNSPSTPTSGMQRSNTVPSRRGVSHANSSPRFSRDKHSDPPTPSPGVSVAMIGTSPFVESIRLTEHSMQNTPIATSAPQFPGPSDVTSDTSSQATTPMAPVGSDTSSAVMRDYQTPKKDTTPLLAPPGGSADSTAEKAGLRSPASPARGFLDIFKQSPGSDGEGKKPNKLQKKRIPGSALSSAHSSSHSLHDHGLQDAQQPSSILSAYASGGHESQPIASPASYSPSAAGLQAAQHTPNRTLTDATLKPAGSPAHSIHSTTDVSDVDMVGDDLPKDQAAPNEREKKRHRWGRFSRSQNKLEQQGIAQSGAQLGAMTSKEQASRSTIGSSQARKSFQEPTPLASSATDPSSGSPMLAPQSSLQSSSTDPVFSDSEKEKKGPMSWIRGKMRQHDEKKDTDRQRERQESQPDLQPPPQDAVPVRGKSIEQQRTASGLTAQHQAPDASATDSGTMR